MNLEVLAWAPTREEFLDAMTTTLVPEDGEPLARYAYDQATGIQIMPPVLWPHAGLNVDEVGEIVQTPAVPDPDNPMGPPLTPAVMVDGWHVNLRFHEPLSDALVGRLPQTDAEGQLLPLFERTNFLVLFPDAVWRDDTPGVPGGYIGTKQLKLFDPATVKSRTRIWA